MGFSYRPCGAAGALICGLAGRDRFPILFLASRLAGAGAFFSRERKEAKGRSRNYVP